MCRTSTALLLCVATLLASSAACAPKRIPPGMTPPARLADGTKVNEAFLDRFRTKAWYAARPDDPRAERAADEAIAMIRALLTVDPNAYVYTSESGLDFDVAWVVGISYNTVVMGATRIDRVPNFRQLGRILAATQPDRRTQPGYWENWQIACSSVDSIARRRFKLDPAVVMPELDALHPAWDL